MKKTLILLLCFAVFITGCTTAPAEPAAQPGDAVLPSTAVELQTPAPAPPAPGAESAADPEAETIAPEPGVPPAADYLEAALAEYDNCLYVYKDYAHGANNFTQKAWMGSDYEDIPPMHEDAEGYSGVSGIACELDLNSHTWGGYMFGSGVLDAGADQPFFDYGAHDAGLDLSGTTALTFYARGETGGEQVEFFMGGLGHNTDGSYAKYADSFHQISLGYVTLSTEWQRFEIPLGFGDFSRIGCGFGWVTNDVKNPGASEVRFYLDEIRYEFDRPTLRPMFLQSYASAPLGADAAVINNFAYLYDQCAAAMALSYAGKHERARQIADAIVYALQNDRYYTDGRLRNAYMSGTPMSPPGWLSEKGGGYARMPGFYDIDDQAWYEDYYTVSTSTGNLAWAILALCEVYANSQDTAYLDAAKQIGDFTLTLRHETAGFTAGYEGWEGDEVKATYLSTEHNIDLISAFGRLYRLTGEQAYADASEHAKAFVLSMYDAHAGCFYTGTGNDGATVSEIAPLDCQTWAVLALGEEFQDRANVLQFMEGTLRVEEGYDFDADLDGVWFEGTAQAALAYLAISDEAKYGEILRFLGESTQSDGSITAADREGVSTGFIVSGTDIPWEYSRRIHIGATAWLSFAQSGRNPFSTAEIITP